MGESIPFVNLYIPYAYMQSVKRPGDLHQVRFHKMLVHDFSHAQGIAPTHESFLHSDGTSNLLVLSRFKCEYN